MKKKLRRIIELMKQDRHRRPQASHREADRVMALSFELGVRLVDCWLEDRKTQPRARAVSAVMRKELAQAFVRAKEQMQAKHAELPGELTGMTLAALLLKREPEKMAAFLLHAVPEKYARYEHRLMAALTAWQKKVPVRGRSRPRVRREMAI